MLEEHRLQKVTLNPWKSAAVSVAAFILVGAMSLVPLLSGTLEKQQQFGLGICVASIVFFFIGMHKSKIFSKYVLLAGLGAKVTWERLQASFI